MEVYFSGDFCGQERQEEAGTEIPIGKSFRYVGCEWLIPAAYSCRQGLILDVLRKIPVQEMRRFHEKWGRRADNSLSKEESVRRRSENPMNFPGAFEAVVNGRRLDPKGWSGIRWTGEGEEDSGQEERALMDAYGLDPESAWYCFRTRFLWTKETEPIRSLELILEPRRSEFPCGCSFETEAGCQPFDQPFTHPFTGEEMRLHVKSCTPMRMEEEMFQGNARFKKLLFPEYYLKLEYSVEPETKNADIIRVDDCTFSDPPVMEEKGSGAASVGILGGSRGVAGITTAGKAEASLEEPMVQHAFSSLHFKPETRARWYICVHRKPLEAMSVTLL